MEVLGCLGYALSIRPLGKLQRQRGLLARHSIEPRLEGRQGVVPEGCLSSDVRRDSKLEGMYKALSCILETREIQQHKLTK